MTAEDFTRMEQEEAKKKTPKKEVMRPYIGMWLKNECGNLPVAIYHPDFVETAKKLAEREWPDQYIFATIQVAERPLITRDSLKSIKTFTASLLEKILSRQPKGEVSVSS